MSKGSPCQSCTSCGACPRKGAIEDAAEELPEDPDNLRSEELQAQQEARFAEMDRRDRSGPIH